MKGRVALVLAGFPLLLTGCGSSSMPGETASGDAMSGDRASGSAPSETASMICGAEIRGVVAHTLTLQHAPRGLPSWSHRLYRCSYLLGAGELRLSVKDLDTAAPGRAYFDALKRRIPGATPVAGLGNFGFPAFQSAQGDMVFLKDHKTLWVDASRLDGSHLPSGMSRQDVAYGVAAAVIACWTE